MDVSARKLKVARAVQVRPHHNEFWYCVGFDAWHLINIMLLLLLYYYTIMLL